MGANDTEYRHSINRSLSFIERQLTQAIKPDDLARESRYSRHHFDRIFQSVIGTTAANYIRNRRMTRAAIELSHTDRRILDIAFTYHFQSQEAFTRAFKQVYGMTPGQYRSYVRQLFRRGGRTMQNTAPKGWSITGVRMEEYMVSLDKQEVHLGKSSARIESKAKPKADGFVTLMQMCSADNYAGQRVRLTAFVKAQDVSGWAGLWMRVDRKNGDMLKFDNMQDRPIHGTRDWNQYSVVLDVSESSHAIAFGILLSGEGKVWVDNFQLDIVDEKTPTTDQEAGDTISPVPVNLDFENW